MAKYFLIAIIPFLLTGCIAENEKSRQDKIQDRGVEKIEEDGETLMQNNADIQGEKKDEELSQSKGGITIDVEKVYGEDANEAYKLIMNNHRYNLEEFPIKEKSTLNRNAVQEYKVISSAMGGHHVTALISFKKVDEKEKQLEIFLREDLIFDFTIND